MDILDGITGKAAVLAAPDTHPRITSTEHQLLHQAVDPDCMQMVKINPVPSIMQPTSPSSPSMESSVTPILDNTTTPSIKSVFSPSTDPTPPCSLSYDQRYAQVDPGANCSLPDSRHLLRHFQTIEPYPVGSVNSSAPYVCEGIGSFPTTTDQGSSLFYTMLHCGQSSGTIVAPDPKVVQTEGLHTSQLGDERLSKLKGPLSTMTNQGRLWLHKNWSNIMVYITFSTLYHYLRSAIRIQNLFQNLKSISFTVRSMNLYWLQVVDLIRCLMWMVITFTTINNSVWPPNISWPTI